MHACSEILPNTSIDLQSIDVCGPIYMLEAIQSSQVNWSMFAHRPQSQNQTCRICVLSVHHRSGVKSQNNQSLPQTIAPPHVI